MGVPFPKVKGANETLEKLNPLPRGAGPGPGPSPPCTQGLCPVNPGPNPGPNPSPNPTHSGHELCGNYTILLFISYTERMSSVEKVFLIF